MRADDDAAGTIMVIIFIIALIGWVMVPTDRCGDGMHSETYVRGGGAEITVCVRD